MPKVYPVAFIGPQHYREFRNLVGRHLPATYREWLSRYSMEKYERRRSGFDVEEVQIEPDELMRYASSQSPNARVLRKIAARKAMRRRKEAAPAVQAQAYAARRVH